MTIGFFNGRPVRCNLLGTLPPLPSSLPAMMKDVWPDVSEAQFKLAMETGEPRLDSAARVARAYCG